MAEKLDLLPFGAELSEQASQSFRFSENYLKLREQFMVQRSKEELQTKKELLFRDKEAFTEKHLRAIWYDGKFEHRGLRSVDGRKITVLSPGVWNMQEGPDFLNAELRLEEEVVRGDVEVHLLSSDWNHHKHHKDFKYERVVLHVTLLKNGSQPFVFNSKGEKIPQLELKNFLNERMDYFLQHFDVDGYPYKSNAVLGECGKKIGFPYRVQPERYDFIQTLFQLAGDSRLLLKGQSFVKLFQSKDFEKVDALLYERMMEGLGYSENKMAMRRLSQIVPYAAMKKIVFSSSGEMRIQQIQALLLYAAGLLPTSTRSLNEDAKKYFAVLEEQMQTLDLPTNPMSKSDWKFKGVRPHNFPARRLAGFSYFLAQTLEKGFFQTALSMVQRWREPENGKQNQRLFSQRLEEIQKFLFQPGWGYFGRHATLEGRKFSQKTALIGEERALTIWVNSFLPALVCWCKKEGDEQLEEQLVRFWRALPTLSENRISKMMLLRFLGAKGDDFPVKTEQIQQGLLQLFQDFCDTKPTACVGCPFPRVAVLSRSDLFR